MWVLFSTRTRVRSEVQAARGARTKRESDVER